MLPFLWYKHKVMNNNTALIWSWGGGGVLRGVVMGLPSLDTVSACIKVSNQLVRVGCFLFAGDMLD